MGLQPLGMAPSGGRVPELGETRRLLATRLKPRRFEGLCLGDGDKQDSNPAGSRSPAGPFRFPNPDTTVQGIDYAVYYLVSVNAQANQS